MFITDIRGKPNLIWFDRSQTNNIILHQNIAYHHNKLISFHSGGRDDNDFN